MSKSEYLQSNFGTSIWMYSPFLKSSFSPSGSCTTNSLMKVATFLLETTVHSHFFAARAEAGTSTSMSSLTLTWQERR
jgi:hypothetical protein